MIGWLLLITPFAALVVLRASLSLVTVQGDSMAPTYRDGDLLLVRRTSRLRRGQPVVFRTPETSEPPFLVKRLVALPGERHPAFHDSVPPGKIAVLGDNDRRSRDSRHFGPVDARSVMGHVLHCFPRAPGKY
jgi:signal peptidase I